MRKAFIGAAFLLTSLASFYGARSAWAHCKSFYDKSAEKLTFSPLPRGQSYARATGRL